MKAPPNCQIQNRLLLPVAKPEVSRDPGIVLIDLSVALLPLVELAARDADPLDDPAITDAGSFAPVPDVIDHGVADIGFGPGVFQSSPSVFFRRTCSAMISAMTSSLEASLALSWTTSFWTFWAVRSAEPFSARSNAAVPWSNRSFCHR